MVCWINQCIMSSSAGDPISITIEKAISGAAMGSLVVQPGGCGEQNMIGLTMPVIATHYLDRTNQWHTVSAGLRQRALTFITRGILEHINCQEFYEQMSGEKMRLVLTIQTKQFLQLYEDKKRTNFGWLDKGLD